MKLKNDVLFKGTLKKRRLPTSIFMKQWLNWIVLYILFLNKQVNSSQHVMFDSFGEPQCQRLKYRIPERNLGSSSFFNILWLYNSNFNFFLLREKVFFFSLLVFLSSVGVGLFTP